MSVQIQQQQQQQFHLASLDKEKIELLKRTFCKGATNDELELFIHACNRMQLDPFMRQIHAVKRWSDGREVMTIQTGIDGYRLIAERTGKYLPGKECAFTYKDGKVFSATAFVKKLGSDNQWHEIGHTVYWDEYVGKKKDGSPTGMWKDKPHVMLGKCAEAGVLRKAFPSELSGVYTKEEMEQADVVVSEQPPSKEQKDQIQDTFVTAEKAKELEDLLSDEDPQYKEDVFRFYTNVLKLTEPMINFRNFPERCVPGLMKSLAKRKEFLAKEAETNQATNVSGTLF